MKRYILYCWMYHEPGVVIVTGDNREEVMEEKVFSNWMLVDTDTKTVEYDHPATASFVAFLLGK